MDVPQSRSPLREKTKIIATVGPACERADQLRSLIEGGVSLFRLNFAHATHDWLETIVDSIRSVSAELDRPVGILGDLSGPKIRLGTLAQEGFCCPEGGIFQFVREPDPTDVTKLTCTYDRLIDDLKPGDRVLLADGLVGMRVIEKPADGSFVACRVEQQGCIRSRQGVNLPGVTLSTPSITEKDHQDLAWAVANNLDFIGLSFVRRAEDLQQLRQAIARRDSQSPPQIVAKIEKAEAVDDLERILLETDAVMVARGDLGVEVDIARVPVLQKQIIAACNQRRIPVITATQMLDSMQTNELPTRAEASDVANAVLDGTDAVMLSGETAIGAHPLRVVSTMRRITREAECLVQPIRDGDPSSLSRTRARVTTEAVTIAAGAAAEHLKADLIAVTTHSGRTAMAVSKQRSRVPILALTDSRQAARRMCLYWGVEPLITDIVDSSPRDVMRYVVEQAKQAGLLTTSGSRVVIVGSSDWSDAGHDLMMVHAVE